mmetsp:Transcript_9968/g.11579  ORF Transcript_9968/g.11579 Transcript_9968/m.11579 type:complete len:296 (-) Transcript_9968:438-1325(-)
MREDGDVKPVDDASLLVLILDLNACVEEPKPRDFTWLFDKVVTFLNAYLLLSARNRVACIALYAGTCSFLYDSSSQGEQAQGSKCTTGPLGDILSRKFQELASARNNGASEYQPPLLSGALSMALCYINRIIQDTKDAGAVIAPRILNLYASKDPSAQYVAVMNALFSAQRKGVPVDCCLISESADSPFLQQGAHLTGGVYMTVKRYDGLLQYLLSVYAVDTFSRQFLCMPQRSTVDFRASCFCHKRPIDLGHVCSVCLSIFCQERKVCSTCGTEFTAAKTSQGGKRKRPATAAN